jgi:predicted MPP superfamily phosphohydrolase
MPAVMLLGQIISWRFFHSRLERSAKYFVLTLYIVFTLAAIPCFYYLYYSPTPPTNSAFLWNYVYRPGFLWEFVHLCWLPLALILTILGKLFNLLRGHQTKGLHRLFKENTNKSKLKDLRVILLLVMLFVAAYGYSHQLRPPEVKEVNVYVPGLSPSLRGYKIALLSDLHYGRGQNLTELAMATATAASHRPDLVILAGDLVDRQASFGLDYRIPMLSLKEVPGGVYGVLGNHDKKVDSVESLISNLDKTNLRILQNVVVNIPNKPITLIGFDDTGDDHSLYNEKNATLPFELLRGQSPRPGDFIILVKHRPEGINDAASNGVNLFLAGHTHGGQVRVPWNDQFNIASVILGYPYTTGEYKIGDMTLYITNGLASGTQARHFAWPEIVILTLRDQPN